MRRLSLPIALVALAAACTSAPDAAAEPAVRTQYLMGTLCTIELPATSSAALDAEAAFREIARVEALLSTWRPGSPLSRVNAAPAGEPVAVSPELARLLARTLELSRETGGAFSPLAGRLIVELWDLRGEGRVPSDEA
ncbi:MAG: FAD:protein FMN transferase, partial [Thermoanaerobaculia bacterium]